MANQNSLLPRGPSAIPTKLWSCLYCGIKFDSKMNLKNHGLEVHPLENNFYKSPLCSDCGCVFQQFKFYMYHIESTGHMKSKYKDVQKDSTQTGNNLIGQAANNPFYGHNNSNSNNSLLGSHSPSSSNVSSSTFHLANNRSYSNSNITMANPSTSPSQMHLQTCPYSNVISVNSTNVDRGGISLTVDDLVKNSLYGSNSNNSCIVSYTDSRSASNKVQMSLNPNLIKRKPVQFSVYFGVPHRNIDTPRGFGSQENIYAWWLTDNFKPSNNMVANNVETHPSCQFPSVIYLELQALISGLRFCLSHNIDTINICGTSELLQRFLNGDSPRYFKTVYHTIRHDLEVVINQLKLFVFYELELISVEDNVVINQLAV